jgi:hypothetical protein
MDIQDLQDSPPAWSTKLETLSHRECLIPCEWCGVFVRGVPRAKNPAPVAWSHTRRKRRPFLPPSCPEPVEGASQRIPPRNRGVYFLHMYSCGKINATFDFPALRSFRLGGSARWNYLCVSVSRAWYSKRVVIFRLPWNLNAFAPRHSGFRHSSQLRLSRAAAGL